MLEGRHGAAVGPEGGRMVPGPSPDARTAVDGGGRGTGSPEQVRAADRVEGGGVADAIGGRVPDRLGLELAEGGAGPGRPAGAHRRRGPAAGDVGAPIAESPDEDPDAGPRG